MQCFKIVQLKVNFSVIRSIMWECALILILGFASVSSENLPVDIVVYENYTIPDLTDICLNISLLEDISKKCLEQIDILCQNQSIPIIMQMLDATSKFPYTGLALGTRLDYGNYDQCLTINHKYEGGRILGKHCTAGLLIPDFSNVSNADLYYKLSICQPDACSSDDISALRETFLPDVPVFFQDSMCATIETGKDFTAADIVTIIILVLCSLLIIVSTAYDFYLYKQNLKGFHPLLLAFSMLTNGKKLLHFSRDSKNQIQTFHGLKVISMMWIVAGHGFVGWKSISLSNAADLDNWQGQRYAGYIATAPLAVDTFFFISGFLLTYQYLKNKAKPLEKQLMSVPKMYLHRYIRLTPALFMIYLVTISLFLHLGSGPLWHRSAGNLVESCKNHWWEVFLYIQNYANYGDLCLTQTWYLAADMQMFILAPLILIPISLQLKNPSGYLKVMVELVFICLFFIALPMTIKLVFKDYTNVYDTHSRIINYVIGMMLAVFMRVKYDKQFLYFIDRKYVPLANLIIWIVMLAEMLVTIICYQDVEMKGVYVNMSIFYSLMRPAWCIGLSWIVYSCYHGYGGIVSWILCRPTLQIFSRLTYCMYLVHGSVIVYYILTIRTRLHFTDFNVFYAWCGHYFISTIISVYWTFAFEMPLLTIEKFIFGGGFSRKKANKAVTPTSHNGNIEEVPKKEIP